MATKSNVTTVRNISGSTMFFSFLGKNGATLADGADIDIPGNLGDMWANDTIQTAALNYALDNNLIAYLRTPIVVGYDATDGVAYALGFDNGSPVAVDPDYGSYSGSEPST